IALIMALVIRAFLVQAFSIPSGSMQPTLLIGDYLLVNKFTYGIRNPLTNKVWIPIGTPQRGDVVVFIFPQDPSKDYIKRVVGLPGDRIQIINKKVMINGKVLKTPEAVYDDP
ncbi:MAG: signal peptidase I, partial [Syntrophobacterales bacterium RIFOXYC2_FULL_60_23]